MSRYRYSLRILYRGAVGMTIGRVGKLIVLVLSLSAVEAAAQEHRLSLEGAAGFQTYYRGTVQTVAFGFAPTRSLTLLVSATRSSVRDRIQQYDDGYDAERGGTEQFVSGELRYAFLPRRRVSPYVLGGFGGGVSHPSVNELFPDDNERQIHVIYYGGGVRIPVGARLDAFVDARFTMAVEARSDYFSVRYPVRAGVAWRF